MQTARLAKEFSAQLLRAIGPDNLQQVVERNRSSEYDNACASHDFCDANMVMHAAFCEVLGRDPDLESTKDTDLWNHAWDLAKRVGFSAQSVIGTEVQALLPQIYAEPAEKVTEAHQAADLLRSALEQANRAAGPVTSLLLLPLIGKAKEIKDSLGALGLALRHE